MKMIKNFTREKYETVMCIAAGMTGVALPIWRRSAAEACDRIVLSVLERADLGAASAALRDCLPAVYDIISCTCIYGSTQGIYI